MSIGGDVFHAVEHFEEIQNFKEQVNFLLNMGIINYQMQCLDDTEGTKINDVFDVVTNKLVDLFHPLQDKWTTHFK